LLKVENEEEEGEEGEERVCDETRTLAAKLSTVFIRTHTTSANTFTFCELFCNAGCSTMFLVFVVLECDNGTCGLCGDFGGSFACGIGGGVGVLSIGVFSVDDGVGAVSSDKALVKMSGERVSTFVRPS
jgi:hypothetical protein